MATEKQTSATHVVNFITGNKNKLGEVKAILEPTIEVRSQALDLVEVQGTLDEVTIAKCKSAAEQVRPSEIKSSQPPARPDSLTPRASHPGRRPRSSRGHLPLLRRAQGPARTVHVSRDRTSLPAPSLKPGNFEKSVN